MQSYKEQQGEIRKLSSVINEKKQRRTIEWEDQRSLQEDQRYQGNISCKHGHNKGQKWQGPIGVEEIKKKWKEYIEELYKNGFNDLDKYDSLGAVTHLEPDILKCEANQVGLRKHYYQQSQWM